VLEAPIGYLSASGLASNELSESLVVKVNNRRGFSTIPFANTNDQLKEKCAVFGLFGTGTEASRTTFFGLWALQHRGQESSGIVSSDGNKLYGHNGAGLVANVYREEDLEKLPGHIAVGHNRYSTSGGADGRYNQPFIDPKLQFAFAHNGNLPDTSKIETFLHKRGITTDLMNDSAMMSSAIGCYMNKGLGLAGAIKKAFPLFTGAFSAVAMDKKTLIAFRDKCGIRPLSIAKLNGGYVIASETCAFDTIGAKYIREVKPGELVVINKDGLTSRQVVKGTQKLDIFEFVYFARPDSLMLGKRVDTVRKNFGHEMAREFPINADIVVPVPDSGIPAAIGYSQATGIKLEIGLIKNRYIHRTFIRPTTALRERDLKLKLNPLVDAVCDKRLILVDDSIVRGSTARQVVSMLFGAGAKEVHLIITSPPVCYPDFYGINTPTTSELVSARMNNDELCNYIGATSLNFLSYKGMVSATGLPSSQFSTSCFNGIYPISIGRRALELPKILPHKARSKMRDTYHLGSSTHPKIAVLASGEGTTVEAFIHASLKGTIASEVGLVICNRADAGVFKRIDRLNHKFGLDIDCLLINSSTHPPNRDEIIHPGYQTISEQSAIAKVLEQGNFDLIALMGYMKRMSPELVKSYGWRPECDSVYDTRMVNTHPGLLPETKGLYGDLVQKYVLRERLPYGGQTLHAVTDEYDTGPIITEHRIVVKPTDTADSLFARVRSIEKRYLPKDIDNFIAVRQRYLREGEERV
jgi:amidophosphoribosyltransferase